MLSGPSSSDRETLGASLKFRERWAEIFGWLVGVGLLIEYGKEIIDCFVQWHLPSLQLVGGLVVTTGVFGEVWFSRLVVTTAEAIAEHADSDVAQANKQAAEANQRAAEANERVAKLHWPRIVTFDFQKFHSLMSRSGTATAEILYRHGDSEAASFSIFLRGVLRSLGWEVTEPVPAPIDGLSASFSGLTVPIAPFAGVAVVTRKIEENSPGSILNDALHECGISQPWVADPSLSIDIIRIVVGPKL